MDSSPDEAISTPSAVQKPKRPAAPKNGKRRTTTAKAPATTVRTKPAPRPYPRTTFEDALQVALKIKELNGGNPWATSDVATAVGVGAKSPKFFYLTAASRDFGLTVGTRETPRIELAELGREIVYAPNAQIEREKKIEAFLKVPIFKRVLDHYKGSSLPEMKYLGNTLEKEFGLAPEVHEEFSTLFRRNCQELGIESGVDGTEDSNAKNGRQLGPDGPTTVVLGELKGTRKTGLKAFVIMPFVEKSEDYPKGFFSEVLRSLITPAALGAGFAVETANRQGSDVIQSTIINDLLEADLVIADLTAHNPNVLFELGVRMAQDKPVALIKATGTGRIFDVDNMLRVLEYDANLWMSTVEKDLPRLTDHIKAAWDSRNTHLSYMKILRRGATAEA
jgi:hypothetical protein